MKTMFLISFALTAAIVTAQSRQSADFVLIRGGTFTMGSPETELERVKDELQHLVTVSDFYLSPSEVTQREFACRAGTKTPFNNWITNLTQLPKYLDNGVRKKNILIF